MSAPPSHQPAADPAEGGTDPASPASSAAGDLDLFADPADYYPATPPPTTETYVLQPSSVPASALARLQPDGISSNSPTTTTPEVAITLHLVGASPTEAHRLWNGGRVLGSWFEAHPAAVRGRTVLELGAGAGVPSLVAGALGARKVVMTDFPDPDVRSAMQRGIDGCVSMGLWDAEERGEGEGEGTRDGARSATARVVQEGFVWGGDVAPLLARLEGLNTTPASSSSEAAAVAAAAEPPRFDVVVLADLLFRHSEHGRLVKTVRETLARRADARAFVVFTSYRPWLRHKDLAFFDVVARGDDGKGGGEGDGGGGGPRLMVRKFLELQTDRPLFEDDPGDEEVRRTVSGFELYWGEVESGDGLGGREGAGE